MSSEVLWEVCLTHNQKASYLPWSDPPLLCLAGYETGIHNCVVKPMLLVPADAPTITLGYDAASMAVWLPEGKPWDWVTAPPAGVYRWTGERTEGEPK